MPEKPVIVFYGYPASGKGTYSAILEREMAIPRISISALLAAEAKKDTKRGRRIKEHLDAHKMVPTPTTVSVLRERLSKPDIANGFILEGFPRTARQAELLDEVLAKRGLEVTRAVFLGIPKHLSVSRSVERFSCPKCNVTYTKAMLKGRWERCPKCRAKLVKRRDQKRGVAELRVQAHFKSMRELNRYYLSKRKLLVLDARAEGKTAIGRKAKKLVKTVSKRPNIRRIK